MSADQMRRAAAKLRERTDALESEQRISWAGMAEAWFMDGPAVGSFVATMRPPVALALAAWLDATAEVVEGNDEYDGVDLDAVDGTYRGAITTARAILREAPDA